jgi:hypothetical protein
VAILIRRGFGLAVELWALSQVLSEIPFWGRLNHAIETNLLGFVLVVMAASALYDLLQIFIQPDLYAPCKENPQMLNLEEDK